MMIIFGIPGVLQYNICKTYKGWLRYLIPGMLTLFVCVPLFSYLTAPAKIVISDPDDFSSIPSIFSGSPSKVLISIALFNFALRDPIPTLILFLMAFVIKQEKSFDELVKVCKEV